VTAPARSVAAECAAAADLCARLAAPRTAAAARRAPIAIAIVAALRVATVAAVFAAALVACGLAAPPAASAAAPQIRAQAAILVEPTTGDVVYQRDAAKPRAIASTTKLMTVLLALERTRLGQTMAAVPYHGLPAESVIGLRAGERLTVADLLRGVLLASANDAAATLATRIGGSERAFVALMNSRAHELGLSHTHYANPIGLDDPDNRSSAEDLVKLTLILRRHAFFREVTDLPRATLHSGARERTVVNRNTLVRNVPEFNGVKTGHTLGAGYVLVGSATKHGITVISAVLGDPSEAAREADSLALVRYGLGRYHRVAAVRRGEALATVKLAHRDVRAQLVATRTVVRTARRGEKLPLRLLDVPAELDGPLPAGTRVGTIAVRWRGRTVARVPLVTHRPIAAASVLERGDDVLGRTLTVVIISAVALGSLQLILLRRRAVRRRRRQAGSSGVA
jgi:D-alanyl-D-alanine carboxypeptidase (penicillin-binding protein 5/6)